MEGGSCGMDGAFPKKNDARVAKKRKKVVGSYFFVRFLAAGASVGKSRRRRGCSGEHAEACSW